VALGDGCDVRARHGTVAPARGPVRDRRRARDCRGEPVPDDVEAAFAQLPDVMERAETRASRVDRAVIDLVEAVVLQDRVGSTSPQW
jgi:exoribonuclease R